MYTRNITRASKNKKALLCYGEGLIISECYMKMKNLLIT